MELKLFRKTDLFILLAVLTVCAALLFLPGLFGEGLTAVVTVDGAEYARVDLDALTEPSEIITPTEPKTVIVFEKGAAYFKSSECENGLCVAAGKLNRKGTACACLPARVVLTIVGGRGDVDAVTY